MGQHRMTVRGPMGQVRWGYLPALTFGTWAFDGAGGTGTITTAQVLERNEFRLTQAPLTVVVPMGRSEWRWTVQDLQCSGETVRLTVARQ
jgi:hypothetical protein